MMKISLLHPSAQKHLFVGSANNSLWESINQQLTARKEVGILGAFPVSLNTLCARRALPRWS